MHVPVNTESTYNHISSTSIITSVYRGLSGYDSSLTLGL